MVSELRQGKTGIICPSIIWNIKKNETHQYQRVGWWSSGAGRWGRWGNIGQNVQTLSCKMSASWGGMRSMLTIVNPVLLLHAGNLSGDYVIGDFTKHRTWEFGGDRCVHQWIVINISHCTHVSHAHRVYGMYTHIPLLSRFSPIRQAPQVLLWGLAPGMCTEAQMIPIWILH